MCGGGAPPPPDPATTANAQAKVNDASLQKAAQLNQMNQNNPFGSMNYTGEIGTDSRTQNVNLNPQLQQLLGGQEHNANELTDMSRQLIADTGTIKPFTPAQQDYAGLKSALSSANAPLATTFAGGSQPTTGNVAQGPIQTSLDTAGVQRIGNSSQFGAQANQAQQAAYQAQTGLLAPHEQQATDTLRSQLAAQGIEQGTPAYDHAINNLQQQQDMIRQQAAASSVGVGNAQQNQLFGQNLAGSQAQFGQALQSGQFGNEAQALSFGQGMSNAQLANGLNQQQFGQNQSQAAFGNQAAGQQFNQTLQATNANQSLYQQYFNNQKDAQTQNINAIMALNGAQQIAPNQPSFNPYATSTASQAAPNLIGLAGSNYQSQAAAAAASSGGMFGALGNTLGGLAGNTSLFK